MDLGFIKTSLIQDPSEGSIKFPRLRSRVPTCMSCWQEVEQRLVLHLKVFNWRKIGHDLLIIFLVNENSFMLYCWHLWMWQKTKMSVSLVMSYMQQSSYKHKRETGPPAVCLLHFVIHSSKQFRKFLSGNFASEAKNHSKQIDHELATKEREGGKTTPFSYKVS